MRSRRLHRRLYESESLQEIDLKWFLEDLCAELRRGGLSRGRNVELTVDSPSEVIGPDVAVPLGLLVTEAITNAYKHAFNERDGGHIKVQIVRESPSTLLLSIRDDGIGFDMAASSQDQSGLGRSPHRGVRASAAGRAGDALRRGHGRASQIPGPAQGRTRRSMADITRPIIPSAHNVPGMAQPGPVAIADAPRAEEPTTKSA